MKLIEFDGVEFKIADEALLVRPIRELFEKDKSKKKENFWKQISYLWFMVDPRSTYQYLVDEEKRSQEIIAQEGLGENWKPSFELREAMEIYRKHTTTTASLLLDDMRKGIEGLRNILRSFGEITITDGRAASQIASSITATIAKIPELMKAMSEAEKSLAKDFATEDIARGGAVKSIGEDI